MYDVKANISESEFRKLAYTEDFNCVSIYCPIQKELTTSKIFFQNQIEKLVEKLTSKGLESTSTQNIRGHLEQILNDTDIWNSKKINKPITLVVFANENEVSSFLLDGTLSSCIHITTNYYLLPLFDKATQSQLIHDSLKIKEITLKEDVTTNRIEEIIPLAYESKIETLYVSSENGLYGMYDAVNNTTMIDGEKSSKNMSLINLASILTYKYGGQVYLVNPIDMPVVGIRIQAILKQQNTYNQRSVWIDRLIGFGLGILGSIIASILFNVFANRKAKKNIALAESEQSSEV